MDRNQLLAFECIVREGNFSRAAFALGLSQAAVSARIQALETEIGGPLFARGGRKPTLTAAGDTFLPFARRALAVLAEGTDAARQAQTGRYGRVTIHAPGSVIDGFLTQAVERYRDAHPRVTLTVRVGHTDQVMRAVLDGVAMLGLVTWTLVGGGAAVRPLARFREPLVAVLAPGHPLAGGEALTVAGFIAHAAPFYPIPWGTPDDARIMRASAEGPDMALPHEMVRRLIARGGGAFFPRSFIADDVAKGNLAAPPIRDGASLVRELALIRGADGPALPAAAEDFVAAVRAAARPFLVRDGA